MKLCAGPPHPGQVCVCVCARACAQGHLTRVCVCAGPPHSCLCVCVCAGPPHPCVCVHVCAGPPHPGVRVCAGPPHPGVRVCRATSPRCVCVQGRLTRVCVCVCVCVCVSSPQRSLLTQSLFSPGISPHPGVPSYPGQGVGAVSPHLKGGPSLLTGVSPHLG